MLLVGKETQPLNQPNKEILLQYSTEFIIQPTHWCWWGSRRWSSTEEERAGDSKQRVGFLGEQISASGEYSLWLAVVLSGIHYEWQ